MTDNLIKELIKQTDFFVPQWYIKTYKIKELETLDKYDKEILFSLALEHYLTMGWKHGYDPSVKFSSSWYLHQYSDVNKLNINPLVHYIKYGKKEGRMIVPHRQEPKFSIIMATYNRKELIAKAVDALLGQKSDFDIDFEIIIAIDGSTDGTSSLLKRKYSKEISSNKIIILDLEHRGVSYARNKALEHAKFDWICYADDDNLVKDNFLDIFYSSVMNNNYSEFYYAKRQINSSSISTEHEFDRLELLRGNFIDLGVICHSKTIFYRAGKFDESLKRLVDWDLILRISALTIPVYLSTVILEYDSSNIRNRISTSVSLESNFVSIQSKVKKERELYEKIDSIHKDISNELNEVYREISQINQFVSLMSQKNKEIESKLFEQQEVTNSLITFGIVLKYKILKTITFGQKHKKYRDIYKKLKQLRLNH